MGVLKNPKHEHFAQLVADMVKNRMSLDDCYVNAGFKSNPKNAARLKKKEAIRTRIEELLSRVANKLEVKRERWLQELARLAFSDIRQLVEWRGNLTRIVERGEDDGPGDVIKEITNNAARFIDSDKITDDMASAIAEVSVDANGALKIKLHSKVSALEMMGKYLGGLKELPPSPEIHNHLHITEGQMAEFAALSPLEKARRLLFAIDKVAREREAETAGQQPVILEGTPA